MAVSKFTHIESREKVGKMVGSHFLGSVVDAFRDKIHAVLTDNGVSFAHLRKYRDSPTHGSPGRHTFWPGLQRKLIVYRLAKP
jgi:hypothetical protein